MRPSPGKAFAQSFEIGEHDLSPSAVAKLFAEDGAAAYQRGVLAGPYERSVIGCKWCEEAGHEIEMAWNEDAQRYEGYCVDAGLVMANESDLRVYRFMPTVFLDWLAEACETVGTPQTLVDGVLFFLGEARLGERYWSLFAARDLNDATHRHDVLERLKLGAGKSNGLVLVAERPGILDTYMDRHKFARLEDVFDFTDGRPILDEDYVRERLSGRDGPSKVKSEDIAFRIFEACVADAGKLPRGKALIEIVISKWPKNRRPIKRSQINVYRKTFEARSSGRPESDAKPD